MSPEELLGRVVTVQVPDRGFGNNPPYVGTVVGYDTEDMVLSLACTTTDDPHNDDRSVHIAMQGCALTVHEEIDW